MPQEFNRYLVVLAGAGLGGLGRYVAGTWIMAKYGGRFPLGTFIINISGSFLIGLIVTLLAERTHWSANLLYLIPIGFIGAYTTFSTFELEVFRSVRSGDVLLALLYVTVSVCLGFAAVWLGILSGRALE